MSLVAIYRLDRSEYDPLFEQLPDLRLEIEQAVACDPTTLSVTFWAETVHQTRFESELEHYDSLDTTQYVDWRDDRALYQIRLSASGTTYWDWTTLGGVLLDSTITREGETTRMIFPDHESLTTFRSRCLEHDIHFSLQGLTDTRSEPSFSSRPITVSQREIIAAALEQGYFEIPREISLVELAAELGISDQAASERLRRGISNLLGDGALETIWAPSSVRPLRAK